MKKDLIQREIINLILQAKFRGIVLSSVRSGKTRILLEAIREDWKSDSMPSVLVCYPNIDIRNAWEAECDKILYHPDVSYCTYASLHKMVDTIWDYVIFDEAHLIPEEHKLPIAGQMAKSNKKVIFASGTYNDITLANIQIATSLPLIVNYTTEDAIKDELISDYTVYIHQYDLDPLQKREFGSKNRKWWSTDVKELARLTNRVENSYGENKMLAALSRMRFINTNTSLYHAVNKWILANLDKRFILFTENEEFGKRFHLPMFNSKSKDDVVMQEFINQKINRLCLIKKGSSGITYPKLDNILITSINSNGENLEQMLGRALLTDTEHSDIHIFVSRKEFQLKWLESALSNINKDKIIWIDQVKNVSL